MVATVPSPARTTASIRAGVLGPLILSRDEVDITPTAPKLRQVVGLLVVRHDLVVRTADLVSEIWGEEPPPSAVSTLQTYVHHLRRLLSAGGESIIKTRANG